MASSGTMVSEVLAFHTGTIGEDHIIRGEQALDIPNIDLFTFVKRSAERYGDKIALVDAVTGRKMTYNQLISNSEKLAAFFVQKGFGKGDCIAIHVPNCIHYQTVVLGTLSRGMIFTTANPTYTHHEINHQLTSAKARVLFTNSELVETAKQAIEGTSVEVIVLMDEEADVSREAGVVRLCDILSYSVEYSKDLNLDPKQDVACLLYSSGTTGLPKGVMHTHNNIISNVLQMKDGFCPKDCSSILCVLPMFHVYGVAYINMLHLVAGITVVSLPKFNPVTFLTAIQDLKIEILPIVPPILLFLLNHPMVEKFDLSSVKLVVVGAAPAEENVAKAFVQKFPGVKLLQGYGMTESLITHVQPFNNPLACKPGSAGFILRNIDWKVICLESGDALGPNTRGEICTRGPQVMKGYLNNSEATDNCLKDGWLQSGDLGYYDEEGCIFVVDRLKELIKYKGFQVAPAELEDALLSHHGISDSCVIGIPDQRAGQLPRAYVIKAKDSDVNEEEINAFMGERFADHKQLRGGVVFVDLIPKSASGKLLRRKLLEEYMESQK